MRQRMPPVSRDARATAWMHTNILGTPVAKHISAPARPCAHRVEPLGCPTYLFPTAAAPPVRARLGPMHVAAMAPPMSVCVCLAIAVAPILSSHCRLRRRRVFQPGCMDQIGSCTSFERAGGWAPRHHHSPSATRALRSCRLRESERGTCPHKRGRARSRDPHKYTSTGRGASGRPPCTKASSWAARTTPP